MTPNPNQQAEGLKQLMASEMCNKLHEDGTYHVTPELMSRFAEMVVSNAQMRENFGNLKKAAEYTVKACLCKRFKTKGFDYHEKHPYMGKCDGGSRWVTPSDMATQVLNSLPSFDKK